MQIKNILEEKAKELLENNIVDRVLAWSVGDFCYDVSPKIFSSADDLEKNFVYDSFCAVNLSKYLISETKKEGKTLIFLKPCDSFGFNLLLDENRFMREKVYAVGVPCDGMLDDTKIHDICGGFSGVDINGDNVLVHTFLNGDVEIKKADILSDKCLACRSKKCVAYDELIGENGEDTECDRFGEVEKIEKMSPEERFAFWKNEFSKCTRCNACRNACPCCSCEKCVFDNTESGVYDKAGESGLFHIIRAFHVAGRCIDCGECSRVCPEHIPLHILNKKFIKDINEFYGEYISGEKTGQRSPIVNFTKDDIEPNSVL